MSVCVCVFVCERKTVCAIVYSHMLRLLTTCSWSSLSSPSTTTAVKLVLAATPSSRNFLASRKFIPFPVLCVAPAYRKLSLRTACIRRIGQQPSSLVASSPPPFHRSYQRRLPGASQQQQPSQKPPPSSDQPTPHRQQQWRRRASSSGCPPMWCRRTTACTWSRIWCSAPSKARAPWTLRWVRHHTIAAAFLGRACSVLVCNMACVQIYWPGRLCVWLANVIAHTWTHTPVAAYIGQLQWRVCCVCLFAITIPYIRFHMPRRIFNLWIYVSPPPSVFWRSEKPRQTFRRDNVICKHRSPIALLHFKHCAARFGYGVCHIQLIWIVRRLWHHLHASKSSHAMAIEAAALCAPFRAPSQHARTYSRTHTYFLLPSPRASVRSRYAGRSAPN